ncbi:AraC family transcriptional regulator [Amycolatopsis anabasis]|uniref:AraC family transcriptional regulator n=1 Tax=Amycolatopsis anabasis TaxID=1840409 RepID=UPI00131B80B6|nr:AraC family transcriptional regulator [Amycolatopsis anabasis]
MAELADPAVRDWDFPRSTASILLMTRFAEEHQAGDVLAGVALTADDLLDPRLQVDARQELAVVRNLAAALGHSEVNGLELGRRYHVTTFGIFGFACVSSPTLRDAMRFALRYLDLSFTFCIPHVSVDGDRVSMVLDDERVPADVARFLVLRDLAAICTMMRDLLPSVCLGSVEFRHPEPSTVDAYLAAFGVRPRFSRPANVSTIDARYLDRPLPQANEHTVAICEAQCRELVARRRSRSGISHEVRERLVRVGGADTGMDAVARELNMSPRTLRRRLEEAGTSYRALVDEVRQALAEEMLATGALSVEDVAIRLGYAEASSFIFAFKRWKGMTPAAYARRRPGGVVGKRADTSVSPGL